jgi:hypothetical protein
MFVYFGSTVYIVAHSFLYLLFISPQEFQKDQDVLEEE